MQRSKYFLILVSTSWALLAMGDRFYLAANAQSARISYGDRDTRVGFNPQMANILSAANRAQQAYYFEQAKFAKNTEDLGRAGFSLPKHDNYELTIESHESAAFIYGIPQRDYGTYKEWSGSRWEDAKEPLYSYVSGISFLEENGSFRSVLCVSKIIGKQKLVAPGIVDGGFVCGEGTEKIR